jgi:diaminopimelate epimerase
MSATIGFTKMSGSGNDFILIDNRQAAVPRESASELARIICRRKISVGADGLILIEDDGEVDFSWGFFNADGSTAEMCGNGARCAARFAHLVGICGSQLAFRTLAGIIRAEVFDHRVKVQLTGPRDLRLDELLEIDGRRVAVQAVNTGVPHAVFLLDGERELEQHDVLGEGRRVRFHNHFAPAGTNVNFVATVGPRCLAIRTYERGVEDETLACGTGATAAALVAAAWGLVEPPVAIHTRGGEILTIHFRPGSELPEEVYLEGDVRVVYQGRLWREALEPLALPG